ncbi:TnsD family Tn7-like transposition protein [Stenotrophomonas maltophilia]|uniref:TnsD family Tn7-like transposition protein n=1 Tax=Stenotrophomonas maltophilia TaxID=40324 RepID=UPI0021BF6ACE|nr:TnsD family Tn7-like transposition protein [Stenotrophomonas maltophilia]UXL29808.1 TnsD family transposase [Stenotrophomonas maltophilia]
MLAYFPKIYPGELFYSVLARYHRHMGASSPIQSMEALFGRRLVVASIDLSGHLQALADRLPVGFGWTAERFIDELTLLPYYTAFQPASIRRRARQAMLRGETDGLMARLGMAAFRVGRVTRLRFCALCRQQMRAEYGECYWRRDHQLPSALVCPDHGCPLQASTVSVTAQSRHIAVAADPRSCPWNAPALVHSSDQRLLSDLQWLAQASRTVMEKPGPAKSRTEWARHYRQGIHRAGLAYSVKRVDQQRLQEQFREHHRGALIRWPGLMTGSGFRGDWLPAMVRKHRKAFHPLQHILLQDFIDHQSPSTEPFGAGPWSCLNPLARHRGKKLISSFEMHRNRSHQVGVFACRCGYVYTRSYFPDRCDVGSPRFQSYGPMLLPALRKMTTDGMSLRGIGHRLQLDPKTVVRLATELGMSVVWKAGMGRRRPASRSPAAEKVAQQTTKKRKARKPCGPLLDWQSVDQKACHDIQSIVQRLRMSEPLLRVTVTCIERQIWSRGWLRMRASKLPLAMECLSSVVESVEQFQRRRAAWIIRQMDKAGEPLRVWQILRRAGLTSRHEGVVAPVLTEYLDNLRRRSA